MLDWMDGRSFLLHEYIANSMLMWSIAGMTVARLGVEREKNNVASLSIYVMWLYLFMSNQTHCKFNVLTLRMLWSCSANIHLLSDSSKSLIPSSHHCMTRSMALQCFKAYSIKLNNEFHRVATSLGMQLTFMCRSFKISCQAGRTRVVEWIILKESLQSWTIS